MLQSVKERLWPRKETYMLANTMFFASLGGGMAGFETGLLRQDLLLGAAGSVLAVPCSLFTTAAACAMWEDFHIARQIRANQAILNQE